MTKRLPTEFAIHMFLERMMILQQIELSKVNKLNYFDEENARHLYFVCKRPRNTVDSKKFEVMKDYIKLIKEGETLVSSRAPVFLQTLNGYNQDFLDLEFFTLNNYMVLMEQGQLLIG